MRLALSFLVLVLLSLDASAQSADSLHNRNIIHIHLDGKDSIWVNGVTTNIDTLADHLTYRLTNPDKLAHFPESPTTATIRFTAERTVWYDLYVAVQGEIMYAYTLLRDREAQQWLGVNYNQLTKEQQQKIKERIPKNIKEE